MSTDEERPLNLEALKATLNAAIGSSAEVQLLGIYDLPKINPNVGEWYFGIKCEECRAISPALPDPSNGQRRNPFNGTGGLRLGCHFCSNEIQGGVDDIISIRWP